MGVFHHQSRSDRRNYVEVRPENILPDQDSQAQYNELTSSDSNNYNTLYDYGSVMHYGDGKGFIQSYLDQGSLRTTTRCPMTETASYGTEKEPNAAFFLELDLH